MRRQYTSPISGEVFTNECAGCGREFTPESPCWEDDALASTSEGDLHKNGLCEGCARKGEELDSQRGIYEWPEVGY